MASEVRRFFSRLRKRLRPPESRSRPAAETPRSDADEQQAAGSQPLPEHDLELLTTQLRRIGHLDARPSQAEPSLRAALLRLWQSGGQSEALRLGLALSAAIPSDCELQLLVADLLWRQRDGAAALPLLSRVFGHPAIAELAQPDPARPRLPAPPSPVAAASRWLQQARLLRSEIRAAQGDHVGARADLADILISEWPDGSQGPKQETGQETGQGTGQGTSTLALARYRAGQSLRLAPLPTAGSDAVLGPSGAAAPTLLGSAAGARYRLLRELGVGASAVVYVAHDAQLDCELALKLFHPAPPDAALTEASVVPSSDRRSLASALAEAQLICALRHPGVLTLYEQDVDGRFLTMELCAGGSLRARLRRAPPSLAATLLRMQELCTALAAVHAVGIEHGDIKPENLLFRARERSHRPSDHDPEYGDLVISDFGIAQSLAAAGRAPPARLRGTRAYLSPERLHGRGLSSSSLGAGDLYSVGVVLFELLAGRLPQAPLGEAPAEAEIEAAIERAQAELTAGPATAASAAELTPRLRPLLRRLLAADSAARPTAQQAAAAFYELAARQADRARS